jgi:hypothetical protein
MAIFLTLIGVRMGKRKLERFQMQPYGFSAASKEASEVKSVKLSKPETSLELASNVYNG